MQIDISGQIRRQFKGHAPIAAFEPPICRHGRTGPGNGVQMTVAGLEFKLIEASTGANVAVARAGVEFAVKIFQSLRAVATMKVHGAFKIGELDLAIAGAEIHTALPWHLDDDVHPV